MSKTKGLVAVMVLAGFMACPPANPPPPPGSGGGEGTTTTDAGTDAGGALQPDGGVTDAGFIDGGSGFVDTGAADAGVTDGGFDGGIQDAGVILASSGLVYSGDRTQSPIDATVAQHLREIVARGHGAPGVFSKVGDSISSNESGVAGGPFLNCFDGALEGTVSWEINVRLGAYAALSPTIDFFKMTRIGLDDSWTRVSLSTRVSMTASWAINGMPAPVDQELAAANPRYAVVMYGSNDIAWSEPYPLADRAQVYERNMRNLTDRLLAQGVVPLLTSMPPDRDFFRYVPVYTGVLRAIAQGRQVPLIDFYKELMALGPPYGLRTDGTHPNCAQYNTCCFFDPASLSQYGYNVRNLITLQALDRMRQVMVPNAPGLDSQAPRVAGDGSATSPFIISQLPFGELRDLRASTATASGSLSCAGAPAVSGPQNLYKLVLTRPTSLRALVLDAGQGGQRISILSGPGLSSCLKTDARLVAGTFAAGTYYLSVNAPNPGAGTEYNFSITECLPGDTEC